MKGKKGQAHYYGLASSIELIKTRPQDIVRAYFDEQHTSILKPLLAKTRKPYKIVSSDELKKLTDSIHHEGVCIVAKRLEPLSLSDVKEAKAIAYLDGSMNPHNLGAMIRTAAHFGIDAIIVPEATALPPAAYRIARGGAEYVPIVKGDKQTLHSLKKKGYTLYATSPHKGEPHLAFNTPCVIILGSETEGVSKASLEQADSLITIEGSGKIESLNVSVAFAIFAYALGQS